MLNDSIGEVLAPLGMLDNAKIYIVALRPIRNTDIRGVLTKVIVIDIVP